jgi:hypothetical protein
MGRESLSHKSHLRDRFALQTPRDDFSRYRLAYRCQRETAHDRALRRAFKLRGKLGAPMEASATYIAKPKWMRWPTYDRNLEEIASAEDVVDAICWLSSASSTPAWGDDLGGSSVS